jgi:hypothetical protein
VAKGLSAVDRRSRQEFLKDKSWGRKECPGGVAHVVWSILLLGELAEPAQLVTIAPTPVGVVGPRFTKAV